jgi:hypothetical protein
MSRNPNDARTEDCGPDAVDPDPFGEEEPRDTIENLVLTCNDEPECPGEYCKMCNGEACNLCGAGCWANPITMAEPCEHSVDERHEDSS